MKNSHKYHVTSFLCMSLVTTFSYASKINVENTSKLGFPEMIRTSAKIHAMILKYKFCVFFQLRYINNRFKTVKFVILTQLVT